MFINIGIRKTRNTYYSLFWFCYETFIYLFEFKVFRHEERETQFLSMLTVRTSSALDSLTQQTRSTFRRPPTGLASASSENQLASSKSKSQLTAFFKFQNPQAVASGHEVIHIPSPIFSLGFLLWHLWLSHPPRVRVNTCTQCVHLTNPCTKLKDSQPN